MTANGAYDSAAVYDAVAERDPEAAIIIPPRWTAVPDETTTTQRNGHRATIAKHGRVSWQRISGYNRRSFAKPECIGIRTSSADAFAPVPANQRTEAKIGCNVLNRMTKLGMPVSVRMA